MKRTILFLGLTSNLLQADYTQMQTLLDTQSAVATAVNSFIEARGVIPASVTVLKSAGYLPNTFNAVNPIDGDPITFSVANSQVRVNSNLESSKLDIDDIDYYTNTFYNREYARLSRDEGGTIVSSILGGHVDVNDNNGAMCTNIQYSTLPQPTISPDYNVGGELKSGF